MKCDLFPEWTEAIIGAAIEVHRVLGPGLLESAYQACLSRELTLRGISHVREVAVPLSYKGIQLACGYACGYRLDLVVQNRVIVEIKARERLEPIHESQLLTYLRLTNVAIGLLVNFHVPVLIDGIVRLVNKRALPQRGVKEREGRRDLDLGALGDQNR